MEWNQYEKLLWSLGVGVMMCDILISCFNKIIAINKEVMLIK